MVRMLFLRDIDTDVQIRCRACGHEGVLPLGEMVHRFGPNYPVLSIAPHYRCSRCLSRETECAPVPFVPPPVESHRAPASVDPETARIAALLSNFAAAARAPEPAVEDEPEPYPSFYPPGDDADEPPPPPEPHPLERFRVMLPSEIDEPEEAPPAETEPDPLELLRSMFPPEAGEPAPPPAPEPEEDPLERLQALLRADAGTPNDEPVEDAEDTDRGVARLFARDTVEDVPEESPPEELDEEPSPFAIRDREPPRRAAETEEPASPQVRDAMAVLRNLVESAAGEAMPARKADGEPPVEPPPLVLDQRDEPAPEPRRPAREADSFENTLSKLRSLLDLDEPAQEPPPKPRGGRGLFRRHKG